MRNGTETRLLDTMITAYVDWREAGRLVRDAYHSWASATGPCVRVARSATSHDDPSGPLAA